MQLQPPGDRKWCKCTYFRNEFSVPYYCTILCALLLHYFVCIIIALFCQEIFTWIRLAIFCCVSNEPKVWSSASMVSVTCRLFIDDVSTSEIFGAIYVGYYFEDKMAEWMVEKLHLLLASPIKANLFAYCKNGWPNCKFNAPPSAKTVFTTESHIAWFLKVCEVGWRSVMTTACRLVYGQPPKRSYVRYGSQENSRHYIIKK